MVENEEQEELIRAAVEYLELGSWDPKEGKEAPEVKAALEYLGLGVKYPKAEILKALGLEPDSEKE